jgi:hypothetical protein
MKAAKADKGTIDAAVAVLLDLKKQLSLAGGTVLEPAATSSGKSNKKKGQK